jgi:hypothetical protein
MAMLKFTPEEVAELDQMAARTALKFARWCHFQRAPYPASDWTDRRQDAWVRVMKYGQNSLSQAKRNVYWGVAESTSKDVKRRSFEFTSDYRQKTRNWLKDTPNSYQTIEDRDEVTYLLKTSGLKPDDISLYINTILHKGYMTNHAKEKGCSPQNIHQRFHRIENHIKAHAARYERTHNESNWNSG